MVRLCPHTAIATITNAPVIQGHMGREYQRRLHRRQEKAARDVAYPHIIVLRAGASVREPPAPAEIIGGEKVRMPAKRRCGSWYNEDGKLKIGVSWVTQADTGEVLGRFEGTDLYGNVDYDPPTN